MDKAEVLLRRYRPTGPPPGLRARCVMTPAVRTWPWAVACAAVLALAVTVQVLIGGLTARLTPSDDLAGERAAIEDLAAMLGRDEDARRFAEFAVRELRLRAEISTLPENAFAPGRNR